MTILFHRLVLPTYTGGLPGTYDYINNPVANGFPGSIPAYADGVKVGGSCEGTYLVAFGEEASSANANRGLVALAENTDYLDDLMHRDLAVPYQTVLATSGGAVSSVTLPAGTYVGSSPSYGIANLFSLLDDSNNEIITSGGVEVKPTSITGATIGDGFSSGSITLNFNANIPNGVQYKVIYGYRSNLASLPADALIANGIRAAEEIDADVEIQFRALQGNNYAWNHAWEASIYALAWRGLDAVYNKSTTKLSAVPLGYTDTLDTAGAGGFFYRTAGALLGLATNTDGLTGAYADVGSAVWAVLNQDELEAPGDGTANLTNYGGGTVGFSYIGNRLTDGNSVYNAPGYAPGFAAFFAGAQSFTSNAAGTATTRIVGGQAGSLAVVSHHWKLTLTGTDSFFWRNVSGDKLSAVAVGYDMLDVVMHSGKRVRFVITAVDSANPQICTLHALDGGSPQDVTNFIPGTCTVERWVRSYFGVGDGAPQYRKYNSAADTGVKFQNFFVAAPPVIDESVSGLDANSTAPAAFFAAYTTTMDLPVGKPVALAWGGYAVNTSTGTGTYEKLGWLYGDGSLASPAITANSHYLRKVYELDNGASAATYDVADGAAFWWRSTSTSVTYFVTISNVRAGGTYELWVERDGSAITFPAQSIALGITDEEGTTVVPRYEGGPTSSNLGVDFVRLSDASLGVPTIDHFILRVMANAAGDLRAYVEHHVYEGN
jgi:hypothetical protein